MFITIEGTEGGGKSTLINGLKSHFEEQGFKVECFREPGGTPFSEKIRDLLIWDFSSEAIHPTTEILLMYASRMQNIYQNILPALERGSVVISDRYLDSSSAYQGHGRNLDKKFINALNDTFIPIIPDLTYWLDLPVEVGMQRIENRKSLDRIEREKISFFEKVRSGYQCLHNQYPERIKRIDAQLSKEEVFLTALSELENFYKNNNR